jgi:hypothetical protein
MADDTRQKLLELGANGAEAAAVSATNDDGTAYSGLKVRGTVTANSPKSSAANVPAIGTTEDDVLAANANRKQWAIQNVGRNPLFVLLGTGASDTVFHFILKGGSADSDGLGALLSDDVWQGIVSVAGTDPKYVVTELA